MDVKYTELQFCQNFIKFGKDGLGKPFSSTKIPLENLLPGYWNNALGDLPDFINPLLSLFLPPFFPFLLFLNKYVLIANLVPGAQSRSRNRAPPCAIGCKGWERVDEQVTKYPRNTEIMSQLGEGSAPKQSRGEQPWHLQGGREALSMARIFGRRTLSLKGN